MSGVAWHGVTRGYVRERDGVRAESLVDLAEAPVVLDRFGVMSAWGLVPPSPGQTVLRGVRTVLASNAEDAAESPAESLEVSLISDVADLARLASSPALALGGGIDAAVVLAAWRVTGAAMPRAYTLRTGLSEYDEVEAAQCIASALGTQCEVVDATPADFHDALSDAVAAAGAPLYNLHPVSRFLLAREVRRRGHDVLVTGDGADAVCSRAPDLDYVPLVARMSHAAGLTLFSPFLDGRTFRFLFNTPADREKRLLRQYAGSAGVPRFVVEGGKRPRWMPPVDVSSLLDAEQVARLGSQLDLAPLFETDRQRVGWTSLACLVARLEGTR